MQSIFFSIIQSIFALGLHEHKELNSKLQGNFNQGSIQLHKSLFKFSLRFHSSTQNVWFLDQCSKLIEMQFQISSFSLFRLILMILTPLFYPDKWNKNNNNCSNKESTRANSLSLIQIGIRQTSIFSSIKSTISIII